MSVRSPEMSGDLFREIEEEDQEDIHYKKIKKIEKTENNDPSRLSRAEAEKSDWESLMKDVPPENEKEAAAKAQWDEAQQKSAQKFKEKINKYRAERDQGNLKL